MGSLPGKEGPLHPPSLAAGVLRLLVLLVGVQGMWRDEVLSSRGGPQGPQAPLLRHYGRSGRGKKEDRHPSTTPVVAAGAAEGALVAGALRNAVALLEAFSGMPPPAELRRLLEQLFAGRGLYLYVH